MIDIPLLLDATGGRGLGFASVNDELDPEEKDIKAPLVSSSMDV